MMKKINQSIIFIVLNWNSPKDTANCLNSLIPQLQNNQRIIVIDNGSTDNSIPSLSQQFPAVQIIHNKHNLGFQGGMNTGIQEAIKHGFDYVMLLNCDTIASSDMMDRLIEKIPEDAAVVSPGIYYMSQQNKLCSTGGKISSIFLETIKKVQIQNIERPIKLEFLPSHAWLIKTSVIKDVGLLDESYFPLYYDDLDYCLRLKQKGYSLYLIPSAKIFHNISVSMGGKNSPNERYFMARNSGYYFRKNMSPFQTPFIFAYRTGSLFLWSIRLLLARNFQSFMSYWKGFIKGWFGNIPPSTN